jgi:hypothetical protein
MIHNIQVNFILTLRDRKIILADAKVENLACEVSTVSTQHHYENYERMSRGGTWKYCEGK